LTGILFYIFQAAQAACEGGSHILIKELESQLAATREELCKKQDKIQVNCNEIMCKYFIHKNNCAL
jgi:hypothetical protein